MDQTIEPKPNNKQQTLRVLFEEYAQPLYCKLLTRTGDPNLSRTILKEVFSDVYRRLAEGVEDDPAALWLEALGELHLQQNRIAAVGVETVWRDLNHDLFVSHTNQLPEAPVPPRPAPTPIPISDWGGRFPQETPPSGAAQEEDCTKPRGKQSFWKRRKRGQGSAD